MKKIITSAVAGLILATSSLSADTLKGYNPGIWSWDDSVETTLEGTINDLSEKLVKNLKIDVDESITPTTFVDLHQLNKTTAFGRILAESIMSDLYEKGLKLTEIRGAKNIRINRDGESKHVLVGTYTKFGDGILINVRIIDNQSGEIISTARTILDSNDCSVFENCQPKKQSQS